MKKTKIVFFTGAGISAESGLQTFRDVQNGLWNEHRIEDVCTPEGWQKNPKMVLDFYNQRRKQCLEVQPNKAHELIASLESDFDVHVITQNVDNLHERAGSTSIIHLHGELMKVRSVKNSKLIYDEIKATNIGDLCEEGNQLRPHIVWFGEMLDERFMEESINLTKTCNVCVIIGSSLQVYPANQIPFYLPKNSKLIIIDPNNIVDDLDIEREFHFIQKTAVEGMELLYNSLLKHK
jgi:NAD-dependent deacetylase